MAITVKTFNVNKKIKLIFTSKSGWQAKDSKHGHTLHK
jgi:hypothetical protein